MERWPGPGPEERFSIARAIEAQRDARRAADRAGSGRASFDLGPVLAAAGRLLVRVGSALEERSKQPRIPAGTT